MVKGSVRKTCRFCGRVYYESMDSMQPGNVCMFCRLNQIRQVIGTVIGFFRKNLKKH